MRKQIKVVLLWSSYISAIQEILNGHATLYELDIPAGKEVNHIINLGKRITTELKLLKHNEIIDKSTHKNVKPVVSGQSILYELDKIHMETTYLLSFLQIMQINLRSKHHNSLSVEKEKNDC